MNKKRRQALASIIDTLSSLKDELKTIADEEDDVCNSLSQHFDGTERYAQVENNVEILMAAVDSLDDIIDDLGEVE